MVKLLRNLLVGLWVIAACSGCKTPDLYHLPLMSESGHFRAVIEIPAGTNHKIEYNPETRNFPVEQRDGKPRIVEFLPYPGNYGFLPSTYMDPARGGDGDPLDVLVIGESVPTGTVMEIVPIAVLRLKDGGEADDKIIAVPADPGRQIISVSLFGEFTLKYPMVQEIIEEWFMWYKGPGEMELVGWNDEFVAKSLIQSWRIGEKP